MAQQQTDPTAGSGPSQVDSQLAAADEEGIVDHDQPQEVNRSEEEDEQGEEQLDEPMDEEDQQQLEVALAMSKASFSLQQRKQRQLALALESASASSDNQGPVHHSELLQSRLETGALHHDRASILAESGGQNLACSQTRARDQPSIVQDKVEQPYRR